jgi:RNA polymerase sigma-70 factor (ECF subfamily)
MDLNSSSSSEEPGEKELIEGVLAGDELFFEKLISRYSKLVFSTALRLTHDQGDAEDVAQEVFFRVHRRIRSFDRSRPFIPWLYRITLNAAYTHVKRKRPRRERLAIEELQPRFDGMGRQEPEALTIVSDLEDRLASRETADLAEEIIAKLPEEYGTVLWMHDVAQISAATLTEALGLSLPAIKSRLHRGRLAVRRSLLASLAPAGARTYPPSAPMPPMPGREMGITCRDVVEDLLCDYLEGRLSQEDRERFEEHLRGCDRCGPFVESYRQIVGALSRMPDPEIPREMIETTLAFVRESVESGRYLNRNWAKGLASAFGRRFPRLFRRRC